MKKTLLALFTLAAATLGAQADIVADFTTFKTGTTGGNNVTVKTGTGDSELTWYLSNSNALINQSGYLFLKYNASTPGSTNTTVANKISAIKFETTSGCSTKSTNAIKITIGDNVISESFAVNQQSKTFEITIPSEYRTENGVYTFQNVSNSSDKANTQIAKITFVEESEDPSLNVIPSELSFVTIPGGSQEQTIKIVAENVVGDITLSFDNDAFSAPESVSPTEAAEGVTIKYTSSGAGSVSATLTVSVDGLTEEVSLTAEDTEGKGTEDSPFTVADVILLNNTYSGTYYVTGTIYDQCASSATNGKLTTTTTLATNNIVLVDDDNNMIAVAISGDTSSKLNISDNPSNVGKTIVITGTLEAYYGAPGVKNTTYISGLEGTSAIADIAADEAAAPAEYFNLQGQRVANPAAGGLYIVRQGNKVSKVIL